MRENGLPNGFLIRPEEIAKLTPDDVHTLFSRAYLHAFPMQSGTVLPQSAADLFRRMLPSPEISLSEGRLSVCRDQTGGLEFCVMEDAQPMPAHEIFPVLTLRGDYATAEFESLKPCTVIRNDGRSLQVKFALAPRECVTLHVGRPNRP